MIVGCTGTGKSFLVKDILKDMENCIYPAPQRILWCYGQYQPLYEEIKKICPVCEFVPGIPDDLEEDGFLDVKQNNLIILDDLMTKCGNDARITRLFSVGSHHRNLSVIYIAQNLFHQGSEMRNISLNTHYLVLFKNPRDKMQIQVLARQMYPSQKGFLLDAYEDCVKRDHGHILIDLKPRTLEEYRVRSGVCPKDGTHAYLPAVDKHLK